MVESLKWGRPTAFFAVPRVWEKLELVLREQMLKASKDEKTLATWAQGYGTAHVHAMLNKTEIPLLYGVANSLFLSQTFGPYSMNDSHSPSFIGTS